MSASSQTRSLESSDPANEAQRDDHEDGDCFFAEQVYSTLSFAKRFQLMMVEKAKE